MKDAGSGGAGLHGAGLDAQIERCRLAVQAGGAPSRYPAQTPQPMGRAQLPQPLPPPPAGLTQLGAPSVLEAHTADPGPALAAVPPSVPPTAARPAREARPRRRPRAPLPRPPGVPPSPWPSPALTISALPAARPRPCRLHAAGRAGGHRALTSGPRASVARQRRPGGDVTAGTPAPSPRPVPAASRAGRADGGGRRTPAAPHRVPMGSAQCPRMSLARTLPAVLAAPCRVPTRRLRAGSLQSSLSVPRTRSPGACFRSPWPHVGSLHFPLSLWSLTAPHGPHDPVLSPACPPIGSLQSPLIVPSIGSLQSYHGPYGPVLCLHGLHSLPPAQCPHDPMLGPHGPPWPHIRSLHSVLPA